MSEKVKAEKELTITPQTSALQQQEAKAKNPEERDSEEPSEAISYGKEERAPDDSSKNNEVNLRASLKKSNKESKQD